MEEEREKMRQEIRDKVSESGLFFPLVVIQSFL